MKKKYKMQEVSFKHVEEFLEFLPDEELKITEQLRKIIFNCFPDIQEKLSFNVPFYFLNRSIFFIWPAAILWGKTKSYSGVRLGFSYGYLITDEINYLNRGERKQVCYHDFNNVNEIESEILKTYLFEAALIDEQFRKQKR